MIPRVRKFENLIFPHLWRAITATRFSLKPHSMLTLRETRADCLGVSTWRVNSPNITNLQTLPPHCLQLRTTWNLGQNWWQYYNNNNNNNNKLQLGFHPVAVVILLVYKIMKLVTNKFNSEGLHAKHVVSTWNLGNHFSICLEPSQHLLCRKKGKIWV